MLKKRCHPDSVPSKIVILSGVLAFALKRERQTQSKDLVFCRLPHQEPALSEGEGDGTNLLRPKEAA